MCILITRVELVVRFLGWCMSSYVTEMNLSSYKLFSVCTEPDPFSSERQTMIAAAALLGEFLQLLMWGAAMAWQAGETPLGVTLYMRICE